MEIIINDQAMIMNRNKKRGTFVTICDKRNLLEQALMMQKIYFIPFSSFVEILNLRELKNTS